MSSHVAMESVEPVGGRSGVLDHLQDISFLRSSNLAFVDLW